MNSITLIGRIGQDIEVRSTGSGMSVANFSIAMNSKKGGEDHTTWMRCVAFGELADNLSSTAFKGDRIIVQGRLQENSYTDKEGNERKNVEMILDDAGVALRWARKDGASTLPSAAQPHGSHEPF